MKRPLSVTILGWVYIAVGLIGFGYHLTGFVFRTEDVAIESVRLLATIAGAFLLRGHDWARWLALAWILFHVILSAFHALGEFAVHCLFCGAIAWVLFRPAAARYFRRSE